MGRLENELGSEGAVYIALVELTACSKGGSTMCPLSCANYLCCQSNMSNSQQDKESTSMKMLLKNIIQVNEVVQAHVNS